MVERIVKLLESKASKDKWLINYSQIDSKELFFIKDKLDMNRAKSVEHCIVTLYKEIEEDGKKLLGSAAFKVTPGMNDEEIAECIDTGLYSATLVKNPYYELVKPSDKELPPLKSNITAENSTEIIKKVIDLVYSLDKANTANVNSMEIFFELTKTKIRNSEGVNYTYSSPELIIELVVDCKGEGEEVELYDMIEVSAYDEELLKEKINADLINVERRAGAMPLKNAAGLPIVLLGEAAKEMFTYYTSKSSASFVYNKYSQLKVGDSAQGDDIKGDKISITLMPEIANSPSSKYVDSDGVRLYELPLIKDGKLLTYHGSSRYSQYCEVEVTGSIPNVKVETGSISYESMTKGECLEVISFSDFQMNGVTGDFGGEIRLAILHKGGKKTAVTGGSITGNITDVQEDIYLSKEEDITGNYQHPKAIKFKGATIAC